MVHLTEKDFGSFKGEPVKKFTWTTKTGFELSVISYGAIVQAIKVPDKKGTIDDVVLGYDDIESYVYKNVPYLGATIGRCANVISRACFEIDGVKYQLVKNVLDNHMHGGNVGFDKVNWQSSIDGNKVTLSYYSQDGEEGYPGHVVTNINCEVKDDSTFLMQFLASTTKKTVVNMTNHSYFNLAGHGAGANELFNHEVEINADKITEVDPNSIPTGGFIKLGGTEFDLRTSKKLGDIMTKNNNLFDHNYCIRTRGQMDVTFVSRVFHPQSGRYLEVYSNQPGVQFYTANFLPSPSDPALIGKDGVGYRRHGGFCLETQNYPDAVNHKSFPRVILKPGEVYDHKVIYKFGADKEMSHQICKGEPN